MIETPSGCLALVVPYEPADIDAALIAEVVRRDQPADADGAIGLLPAPAPRYRVTLDTLEHEDETGVYEARLRIEPA